MSKKKELPNGLENVRARIGRLEGATCELYVDYGSDNYRFYRGPILEVRFGRLYVYFKIGRWETSYACLTWEMAREEPHTRRFDMTKVSTRGSSVTLLNTSGQPQHTFNGSVLSS